MWIKIPNFKFSNSDTVNEFISILVFIAVYFVLIILVIGVIITICKLFE